MKIIIVDDHKMVVDGFISLFSMYGHDTLRGEIECSELLQTIERENPDILLIDIELGKLDNADNGIKLTKDIVAKKPDLKVILISGFDLPVFHEEARKCGAKGFILKSGSESELLLGIELVKNDKTIFPKSKYEREKKILAQLESVHVDILQLLANQKSVYEICDILHFSERSIRSRIEEIRKVLKVDSTNKAIAKAIALGIAKPGL